ncbi:MAG TPA: hypothetical protein VF771_20155 [Longimicrobiaceae bacterium]
MVQFAHPPAHLGFRLRALAGGIRWFREPGAWVERPRALPVVSPPLPADLRTPLARRFHGR